MRKIDLRAWFIVCAAMFAAFVGPSAASAATHAPAASDSGVIGNAAGTATREDGPARIVDIDAPQDIIWKACTPALAPWVHIYTAQGVACFGNAGTAVIMPTMKFHRMCSGNNYVTLHWAYGDGEPGTQPTYWVQDFNPGQTVDFAPDVYVYEVTIRGWVRNGAC